MMPSRSVPPAVQPAFSLRALVAPMATIVLGSFMAILNMTVVNVALPTLGRAFDTDLITLQWVITGYMLAQAAVIPLAGWLSDRFGTKRVYLTALGLFSLGSLLCATAWSAPALVGFRVLQGLGGGMLMPIGMAFMYRMSPPDRRGQVMSVFGVPQLLAPAIGPVLAGWLLQYTDWRLVFLINVLIGAVAVLVGLRALPSEPSRRSVGALDVAGMLLGPIAFASLSYGIGASTGAGWTGTPTVAGISVGLVALLAFVARELTAPNPLLELRVFRSRDFTLTIVTQWVGFAGLFGTMFLLPMFLQQVRGYGSLATGLYLVPQALVAALIMPLGGRIFDRFGARPSVVTGLGLAALAMSMLAQVSAATSGEELLPALVLWGAGMGLLIMPLGTHLLNSAPRDLVSRVTSLSGALQSVVASLAVASFATLLQFRTGVHLTEVGADRAAATEVLGVAQALAFGDVYRVALAMLVLGLVLALTLRRPARQAGGGLHPAPRPASATLPGQVPPRAAWRPAEEGERR